MCLMNVRTLQQNYYLTHCLNKSRKITFICKTILRLGKRSRLRLKYDDTRAKTRFPCSVKRTSPFKQTGASVQATTGSRGVRINGSNAGYTMFLGSVKSTGYPLHSPVFLSLPVPCVTVCHHISTGSNDLYCCTVHLVDSLIITQPTNALIVCHLL